MTTGIKRGTPILPHMELGGSREGPPRRALGEIRGSS